MNNIYKNQAIKLVTNIIEENNFLPKWFFSIHYISNRAIYHDKNHTQFRIKNETNTLEKVEREFRHFKNILLCRAYNKSSVNKISYNKFRFISFYETGEANYAYHNHIIVENIPEFDTQEEVDKLLKVVQLKHPGIENSCDSVDVRPYQNRHISYCLKTATRYYLPLDLINSDIN